MQASWNAAEIYISEQTAVLTREREREYDCKRTQGPELPPAQMVPRTQGPENAEPHQGTHPHPTKGTSSFQSHPSDAGQFSVVAQQIKKKNITNECK